MDQPQALIKSAAIGRFYWIGVVFPNGYFYQTGYMDYQVDSCGGFQTFTTRLTPGGSFVDPSNPYGQTHCGLSGQHNFKIAIASITGTTVTWQTYMDNSPIGPTLAFPASAANESFPKGNVQTISENASTSALPPDPSFPNIHYPNALQFQSGSTWVDSSHGYFHTITNDCGYRAMNLLGVNNYTTGNTANLSSPGCYSQGQQLW